MLDRDALSQLKQLKKQINESKDRAQGVVKATQGRFGFAVLDDGREVFLPPEQMQRVFPGDRIALEVVPTEKGKPQAQLEKLLESSLSDFTGRYEIKGKGHFVAPDVPRFNRWLFVPPNARNGAKPGDYVCARVRRHPFRDGKPQVEITRVIGAADSPGIATEYAAAYWNLADVDATAPVNAPSFENREDLTGLPLATIDSSETEDMDDALCAEATDDGWRLWVAIADPLPWLAESPALDQQAQQRAGSVYLPGQIRHMLPKDLACDKGSLHPEQDRPALVCEIRLTREGTIRGYHWHRALIRSHQRLSYQQLSDQLQHGSAAPELQTLADAANALLALRHQHQLVLPDRPDYQFELDGNGKISGILRRDKTQAHRIVEECMLAANRCAAETLAGAPGVYVSHAGFRPERLGDVRNLVQEHLPELGDVDPRTLEGYISIMRAAAQYPGERPLLAVFSRWLDRSRLSSQPAPHFGLGLARYTTATSPLRKYHDLSVHRLLAQKLAGESLTAPTQEQLDALQETGDRGRRAAQMAEQWLKVEWLAQQHQQSPEREWDAEVFQINSRGAGVRLQDNGITGSLDLSGCEGKFRFDAKVLELTNGDRRIQLEQVLRVKIAALNEAERSVTFAPVSVL